MTRSRGNSLVQSIATHAPFGKNLDDELLGKLKRISVKHKQIDVHTGPEVKCKENKYSKYDRYVTDVDVKVGEYQTVINQAERINEQLALIVDKFCVISSETNDFTESTFGLFEKFRTLDELHRSITEYLSYFETLDPIVRNLHHFSSPNIVRKNSFKSKLSKIDESLQFLCEHEEFRDAEAYRIKFKQCMVRCCSLMATYLSNCLRSIYEEVIKSPEGISQSATRDALLYNKFSSIAIDFYSVSKELSSRYSNKHQQIYHDELGSILQDCYNEYFRIRMKLLSPLISGQLGNKEQQPKKLPLVKDIQDNLLFFTQLCEDEHSLIVKFFSEKESKKSFNEWLFRLCEPFHDHVREKVLQESDVASLCDAVTLLNKYYQFEENSEEYDAQFNSIQLDKIFEPLLQDVQYRLIFRAQIYVETSIIAYRPTKDAFSINYRKSGLSKIEKGDGIVRSFLDSISESSDEVEEMRSCYPPVTRAIALLSKIYQMVNSSIFDTLAHHIVHDCVESLKAAHRLVRGSEDNLDMNLCYLKNLLMLRKQVQNFDIQYVCNETYVDFSGLRDFLRSLAHGGLSAASNSVLSLAREGAPKVVNNMVDARSELSAELRNAIKELTEAAAHEVVGACLNNSEVLISDNTQLRKNVETVLPRIHNQMRIFIKDGEVRIHLIDAIQELVIRAYAEYYEDVTQQAENGKIAKEDVSEIMYVDVFADLFNNIASQLEKTDEKINNYDN
ncbi:LAQU0S02e09296g1_1 [Lachancea quebecensis]|uniref:Conserved oligomeric Golgi complex subunit 3 n=1 Tax=Lachancea quebecensis TaxID=1654605 RepID=A0A0P1KQW9_9SACH|nr:LAQU0S02e09296g1_1 [Lachancea quebecensis]